MGIEFSPVDAKAVCRAMLLNAKKNDGTIISVSDNVDSCRILLVNAKSDAPLLKGSLVVYLVTYAYYDIDTNEFVEGYTMSSYGAIVVKNSSDEIIFNSKNQSNNSYFSLPNIPYGTYYAKVIRSIDCEPDEDWHEIIVNDLYVYYNLFLQWQMDSIYVTEVLYDKNLECDFVSLGGLRYVDAEGEYGKIYNSTKLKGGYKVKYYMGFDKQQYDERILKSALRTERRGVNSGSNGYAFANEGCYATDVVIEEKHPPWSTKEDVYIHSQFSEFKAGEVDSFNSERYTTPSVSALILSISGPGLNAYKQNAIINPIPLSEYRGARGYLEFETQEQKGTNPSETGYGVLSLSFPIDAIFLKSSSVAKLYTNFVTKKSDMDRMEQGLLPNEDIDGGVVGVIRCNQPGDGIYRNIPNILFSYTQSLYNTQLANAQYGGGEIIYNEVKTLMPPLIGFKNTPLYKAGIRGEVDSRIFNRYFGFGIRTHGYRFTNNVDGIGIYNHQYDTGNATEVLEDYKTVYERRPIIKYSEDYEQYT